MKTSSNLRSHLDRGEEAACERFEQPLVLRASVGASIAIVRSAALRAGCTAHFHTTILNTRQIAREIRIMERIEGKEQGVSRIH